MPLISTATTFSINTVTQGQRISQVSYLSIPWTYYYDITINTSDFTVNILEDKIEPTFGLADINLDFFGSGAASDNLAVTQTTMPTAQSVKTKPMAGYVGWSTASYVIIDDPDIPGGTTATAVLNISSGTVTGITLTNPGSGYVFAPTVNAYDPNAPRPAEVTLAKLGMPTQLPGGVRVDLDPSTMVTATMTYLRGTIPITIDQFKSVDNYANLWGGDNQLDHQTLWGWQMETILITGNKRPNIGNLQISSAGLGHKQVAFYDAFPYLGKTLSSPQLERTTTLLRFNNLVNVFREQVANPSPKLEISTSLSYKQPIFYIFVHDKNFTSFQDCTFKFLHSYNRYDATTATITVTGQNADEFSLSNPLFQLTPILKISSGPPISTDWTQFFETVYCIVADEPVAAGNPVQVQVATAPFIDYLYLTPVTGVLDRTKVLLNNGTGTFNILTTTLQPGEVAECQVGFKYWPHLETVTKTLS